MSESNQVININSGSGSLEGKPAEMFALQRTPEGQGGFAGLSTVFASLSHADVSKDDMATIVTSKMEEMLRRQVADKNSSLNSAKRARAKAERSQTEQIHNLEVATARSVESTFRSFLESQGYRPDFSSSSSESKGKVSGVPTHFIVDTKVSFRDDLGSTTTLTRRIEVENPSDLQTLYRDIIELDDQIREINEEIVRLRALISNIPAMDRKAKAQIAEAILQGTEGGQAIINALNSITVNEDAMNLLAQ